MATPRNTGGKTASKPAGNSNPQTAAKSKGTPGRGNPQTAAKSGTLSKMKDAVRVNKEAKSRAENKRAEDFKNRELGKKYAPMPIEQKNKKGKKGPGKGNDAKNADPIILEYNYNPDTGESTPSVVMVPERDVVNLATNDVDAATITNLLFENIGANELVKFVRNDTIEGLNPYYNIISNLSDIRKRFDPSNLISEQITDLDKEGYSINLDNKIPDQDYLDTQGITDYVYIDSATGDLVIHVVNMKESETVEVQIDTNGTIYEVTN